MALTLAVKLIISFLCLQVRQESLNIVAILRTEIAENIDVTEYASKVNF